MKKSMEAESKIKEPMGDEGRLRQLFDESVEVPRQERDAFLERACAGDALLMERLRALLEADDRASCGESWNRGALWNEASASAVREDAAAGQAIGPYRIVATIARGGMGEVYQATRIDVHFSKNVAIKRILAGFDSRRIVHRFRAERQILANLDHPNIARLLDGGADDQGRPYLVMEYVEGIPPLDYCEKHGLGIRGRLEIFCQICAAVHYAHQRLVIHRDLKPGNILITVEGTAKLLDFGIAKVLTPKQSVQTQTAPEARMITARYASPEQISGELVGAASDIYSLGVVLYELLTGASPYRSLEKPGELLRSICFDDPISPSARKRELKGDLDAIVLKALRKNPDDRYASADQFSEDILRYLEQRPVRARREVFSYIAGKFLRRNWLAACAAAVAVLSLAGGLVAVNQARARADRRFNDVRSLAHSYLFEVYDGLNQLPSSVQLRQLVVKRALEYLDRLANERGGDVELSRELADAYYRVGCLQGAVMGGQNLGDPKSALQSLRKALALREFVAARRPDYAKAQLDLAEARYAVGTEEQGLGNVADAARDLRASLDLAAAQAAKHPSDVACLKSQALSDVAMGRVTGNNDFPNLGDAKGALSWYREGLTVRNRIAGLSPGDRDNQEQIALIHDEIAALDRLNGLAQASVEELLEAVRIEDELYRAEPANSSVRRSVAVFNRSLALAFVNLKQPDKARAPGDRSTELFERAAREDPNNARSQEEVADAYLSQGFVQEGLNHYPQAFTGDSGEAER
jgi:tetratricopeptide (TPR) repeat protein/tRNA A-37 threonylcarbamoyl transferase component Bud32